MSLLKTSVKTPTATTSNIIDPRMHPYMKYPKLF